MGLLDNIQSFGQRVRTASQPFLDVYNTPEFQQQITLGTSLLGGAGVPASIQAANQAGLLAQNTQSLRRQREAVKNLLASGSFTEAEKQLILASGQPVATALSIQNRKRTSSVPLSAIGKIRQDLKRGLINESDANAAIAKLTSTTGTTPNIQKGGSFKFPNGGIKNVYFDPSGTDGGYFEIVNGERKNVDVTNAVPITQGFFQRTTPTFEQFNKHRVKLVQDRNSLRKYTSYLENIKNSPQGVNRLGAELSSIFKTLNFDKLSKEELSLKIAKGEVQSLLGASRLETIGGGVMTEQDALRVLATIGGNVDALQNPQVVEAQLSKIFRDKFLAYEDARKTHNINVKAAYNSYGEIDPIDFDTSLLSEAVQRELGLTNTGSNNNTEQNNQQNSNNNNEEQNNQPNSNDTSSIGVEEMKKMIENGTMTEELAKSNRVSSEAFEVYLNWLTGN